MSGNTLAKRTNNGFTILPNCLIDRILATESSHTVDTLALALYLVRHIPGQNGMLVLTGDFSQANVCQDLGWGRTNRARLKRALSDLETLDVVSTELRDNNMLVLHIKAELATEIVDSLSSRPHKKSSHPGPKDLSCPPYKDFSRHNPVFSNSDNKNNKTNYNQHHHHSEQVRITSATPKQHNDDDITKLLTLYRTKLGKPVSPKICDSFAASYVLNGRPFELVVNGFNELATNPILNSRTTSPNAVWELPFLRKKAQVTDNHIRQTIESLRYHTGSDEDCRACLEELIKAQGFDKNLFNAYYRCEIQQLLDQRRHHRDLKVSLDSHEEEFFKPNLPTIQTTFPETETLTHPNEEQIVGLDAVAVMHPDQTFSGLSENTPTDCLISYHTIRKISDFESIKQQIDAVDHVSTCRQINEQVTLDLASPLEQSDACLAQFETARNKSALVEMLVKSLSETKCETMRARIQTLCDLASINAITFDRLRMLIRIHFNRSSAAA